MVGHDGHRGWVYYLAVEPTEQRTGIGHQLMSACAEWAQSRGVPKIQLTVRAANSEVLAFYVALGYTQEPVAVLSRRLDG